MVCYNIRRLYLFIYTYIYIYIYISEQRDLTIQIISCNGNVEAMDIAENNDILEIEESNETAIQCNIFIIYKFMYCDILVSAYVKKKYINFFCRSINIKGAL